MDAGERQPSEQLIQWDILLEAYNEFGDFDLHELTLIESLRAMRMVYYLAGWYAAGRIPLSARLPRMTDEDFWRRQIALFIEQERLLHEPPLQLSPQF